MLREDSTDEESLQELAALVETAGGQVVGSILQSRDKPDPHSFIGEGKVEEVKTMVALESATLVIFDNDLSPSQIRVLTELLGGRSSTEVDSFWTFSPSGLRPGRDASRWSWPSTSICCPG